MTAIHKQIDKISKYKRYKDAKITLFSYLSLVNKNVSFVKFLDVGLDFSHLFLVLLFPSLQADSVNSPNVCQFLILKVYFIPLSLEALTDGIHFLLWEALSLLTNKLLLLVMLFMQSLDHFILVLDVLFYFLDVLRDLTEILLLQVVYWLWCFLCYWQNVLNCISNNEVLSTLHAMDWSVIRTWDWLFFMSAVIRKLFR